MSRRLFGAVALIVLLTLVGASWRLTSVQARLEDKPFWTRLIGPQTLLFQHARVSELLNLPVLEEISKQTPDMKEQMSKGFQKEMGMALADLEAVTIYLELPKINGGRPEEPRPPYFLLQAKKAIDTGAIKASMGDDAKTIQFGKYALTIGKQRGICLLDERTALLITFGGRNSVENASQDLLMLFAGLDASTEVPEGLKPAVELALTNKHLSVMGFQVPKDLGDLLQEQMKKLPPMMAMFKPLGVIQSGVMTTDYVKGAENDLQMKLLGRFPDAGSAKAAQNALKFAISAGKMAMTSLPNRNDPEMKKVYDFVTKQLDQIKFEANDQDVVVNYQMNSGMIMPMLLAAIEKARNAADRMISASNMRQCVIAMHNYHNDYNKMPEAMTMKNGKPMHSWRVMMLPYLEQDNLFKQIKLDEPWDSEANKKLFESIATPKIYAHPGMKDGESRMTYYKVFVSKPDASKPRAGFTLGKPITLGQITVLDGTSNTIAMIEAGPPVLWVQA